MARMSTTIAAAGSAALLALGAFTAGQAADRDPERPATPDSRSIDDPVGKMAVPGPGHPAELLYVPINSCRVVNTRKVNILGKTARRNYYVAGATGFASQGGKASGCGIPGSATAVVANLWLPRPQGAGSLKAWPAGASQSGPQTMYYTKNSHQAQQATLAIRSGTARHLSVKNARARTHLVVDVTGYYLPPLYAYISADGSVIDQSGRLVSSTRTGIGTYTLVWDRDVSTCASQGSADITGNIVSVYTSGSSSYVYVYNNAGTPTDYWANITLSC